MSINQIVDDGPEVQVISDNDFTSEWIKLWLSSPELKMLCQLYRSGAKNVIPRSPDLKKMVFSIN